MSAVFRLDLALCTCRLKKAGSTSSSSRLPLSPGALKPPMSLSKMTAVPLYSGE